jgi:hypothetical protein
MFNANHRAVEVVKAALSDDFNTHLAAIAAERGTIVPVVVHLYQGKEAHYQLPAHEIQPPRMDIDGDSSAGVVTAVEMWVLTTSTALDPVTLTANSDAYLTALVRTLNGREGTDHRVDVLEGDTSPPGATQDGTAVQAVGTRVRVLVAETA